jgi:hypothetical protein
MAASTDACGQNIRAVITAARPRCQRVEPKVVVEHRVLMRPNAVVGSDAVVAIAQNYQSLQRVSDLFINRAVPSNSVDAVPECSPLEIRARLNRFPRAPRHKYLG